jgi:hypothetical protein
MRRIVPAALACVLFANVGCHYFFARSKNPTAPKESSTAAADVEKDFMRRWTEKRTADLVTQGVAPETARAQAIAEFKAKFDYTDAARQAK